MSIIIAACFLIAGLCFLLAAAGAKTQLNLSAWGLLALTIGLALALHVWAL